MAKKKEPTSQQSLPRKRKVSNKGVNPDLRDSEIAHRARLRMRRGNRPTVGMNLPNPGTSRSMGTGTIPGGTGRKFTQKGQHTITSPIRPAVEIKRIPRTKAGGFGKVATRSKHNSGMSKKHTKNPKR